MRKSSLDVKEIISSKGTEEVLQIPNKVCTYKVVQSLHFVSAVLITDHFVVSGRRDTCSCTARTE